MISDVEEDYVSLVPFLLLPFEDDEAYSSYCNRNSPFSNQSMLRRKIGGKISMLFPTAIKTHVSGILLIKPIDQLLHENTHFPLFAPYLTEQQRMLLRAHFMESSKNKVSNMTGMVNYKKLAGGRVRVCRACVAEDIKRGRIPIWRRASLLPGVLHCPRHAQRYLDFCGRCVRGMRYSGAVRLLQQTCFCGRPLRQVIPTMSDKAEQASIRVSRFVQFAIDGGLSHLSPKQLIAAYENQARKIGMITNGGRVNSRIVESLLDESGIGELVRNFGLKTGTKRLLGRCLRGKSISQNPIINAIVQSTLFTTTQALVEAAWLDTPRRSATPSESSKLSFLKAQIEERLAERGSLTRTELHSFIQSKDWQVLLEYEYDWVNEKVPRARRKPFLRGGGKSKRSEIDARTAKHVETSHKELISAPDLPRFSIRRLLDGSGIQISYSQVQAGMPRTFELLSRLVETPAQHSLRRVKAWLPEISLPEEIPHRSRLSLIRAWMKRNDMH